MGQNGCLPGYLEELVCWALREQVGDAEPSPAVWEGIRRRVAAQRQVRLRASLGERLRMRTALQAVAVGLVLVGLGLSATLRSPARQLGQATGGPADVARWRDRQADERDALSGRLVWLASRQPPAEESGPRRGFIE